MNNEKIEPGLLSVLRIYIFLRFSSMALISGVFLGGIGLPFSPEFAPTVALFAGEVVFFVIYLYWPRVQQRIGRLYLPVALLVASLGPIVEMRYLFAVHTPDYVGEFWLIFPFLTVPLILTAWQYSYRVVVTFVFTTTLMDLGLVLVSHSGRPFHTLYSGGSILTRTLFFLVIGKIVSTLMEAQRQQRRELAQANRRLVRYAATLEQLTITQERNRIARELHDTLAHTLSALVVQLDALAMIWENNPEQAQRILDHALDTTRNGLDETRRALQAMRASPLEDLGLALAVRSLVQHTADREGLALTMVIPDDLGDIPPEVEQTFYRVAQEALENTVRHSQAQTLRINLARIGKELVLTIVDDGIGLPVDLKDDDAHFGMRGMRERAELIGGTLTFQSGAQGGTIVTLKSTIAEDGNDL